MAFLEEIANLGIGKGFIPFSEGKFIFNDERYSENSGLILAYSPMCSHCVKFTDVYNRLQKTISKLGINFVLGAMDVKDKLFHNEILSDYLEIAGVPTLFYSDGTSLIRYDGPNDYESLLKYILKMKGRKDLLKGIEKAI